MGTFDGMTLSEAREALATIYKLKILEDPCWEPRGDVARWLWARYLPETIKGRCRPPSATKRSSSAEWHEVRAHVIRARAVVSEVSARTGRPLEIRCMAGAYSPWKRWSVEIRGAVEVCIVRLDNECPPDSIAFLAWCYTVSLAGARKVGRREILQVAMRHRHPFHHMWSVIEADGCLHLFWLGNGRQESFTVCPVELDIGEAAEVVDAALVAAINSHAHLWGHANATIAEAA